MKNIKRLTARFPSFFHSLTILAVYTGWILLFKLISLTFITYFVMSSTGVDGPRFEEVNEALGSSELGLMALCALGFVLLLRLLQPYYSLILNGLLSGQRGLSGADATGGGQASLSPSPNSNEVFTPQRFERQFLPGFLHGSVLATGVTLAFLISGIYRYLGFFVQTEQTPLAVAALLIRVFSIGVLVYCEEFIFRHRILQTLIRKGPAIQSEFWHNFTAAAFTGVLYVAIKFLQFDLSWMQGLTLFLISLALGFRTLSTNDFVLAAGFWSALLIVFQPMLSLPILGHDFSGLVLIKYQAVAPETSTEIWEPLSTYGETIRFITGGAGGPLAGFAFQLLLIFDILRGAIRYKKFLFRTRRSR